MDSQDGLAYLATAMIDPGDYVLVPDPGYPIYEAGVFYPIQKAAVTALTSDFSSLRKLKREYEIHRDTLMAGT